MIDAETQKRLQWIADVYSHESEAITDEVANTHLFDRLNDFGMKYFLDTYRPLTKLREQRGDVQFKLGNIVEAHKDVLYVDLLIDDELVFVARIRIEEEAPRRIKYWSSYPPLPADVEIRPYQPDDADGCVELEKLCPFESADGTKWTVDRGQNFDDYLKLMAPIDACVAELNGQIIGFFSTALRPISFSGEACYAVYQHHYRVHPEHRRGSISEALACQVDSRRTFDALPVVFPYSLIDPDNLHMQNVGFPPVKDVRIARLTLPLDRLRDIDVDIAIEALRPRAANASEVQALLTHTHGDRTLFAEITTDHLEDRWSRIPSFNLGNYQVNDGAMLGVWEGCEENRQEKGDENGVKATVSRLAFIFDYGFKNQNAFVALLKAKAHSIADESITHLCLVCDTRADEYTMLKPYVDQESLLAVHTLPWICEPLAETTLYCDGVFI